MEFQTKSLTSSFCVWFPSQARHVPEFIGTSGDGIVELILYDFIQLQLVGYTDVIAVISQKKYGEMCVIYVLLLGPSHVRIFHKANLAMNFKNINVRAFTQTPVLGITSKDINEQLHEYVAEEIFTPALE